MKNLLKINLKPTCLFLYRHKYKPIPSTLYICKPRNSLRVFGDRLSGKYSFLIFSPCNEIVGVKRMVLGKKKKKKKERRRRRRRRLFSQKWVWLLSVLFYLDVSFCFKRNVMFIIFL